MDRSSESGFSRPDWYQTMTAGGMHWRFLLRGSFWDNLGGRVRWKGRGGGGAAGTLTRKQAAWLRVALPCGRAMTR